MRVSCPRGSDPHLACQNVEPFLKIIQAIRACPIPLQICLRNTEKLSLGKAKRSPVEHASAILLHKATQLCCARSFPSSTASLLDIQVGAHATLIAQVAVVAFNAMMRDKSSAESFFA